MAIEILIIPVDPHVPFADAPIQDWTGYVSGQPCSGSIDGSCHIGLGTKSNLAGSLVPYGTDVRPEREILLLVGKDGIDDLLTIRDGGVGRTVTSVSISLLESFSHNNWFVDCSRWNHGLRVWVANCHGHVE